MLSRFLKIFLLLYFSIFIGKGQTNLVPNPSFEIHDTCPDNLSQINRAVGWYSAKPSPDYYNSCAPSSALSGAPSNYFGYQYPASGNAYAGYAAMYAGMSNTREYIQSLLTNPLQINTKYYVSFKVCRSFRANFLNDCSCNKLGVLFSTIKYDDSNPAPVCNCGHVYTNSIITDTLNWTRISGSFIADSNYKYVSLGNFFTSSFTDSIQTQGTFCDAYYYIDDVCVSDDSIYAYTYNIKNINKSVSFTCFPNPFNDHMLIRSDEFIAEVKLYDIMGCLVRVYTCNALNEFDLNLINLPKGNYSITVQFTNLSVSYKRITKT
ncbi:MAG: T9SS type A sorting domain-containing protein [Bacteroidia bacterium]